MTDRKTGDEQIEAPTVRRIHRYMGAPEAALHIEVGNSDSIFLEHLPPSTYQGTVASMNATSARASCSVVPVSIQLSPASITSPTILA